MRHFGINSLGDLVKEEITRWLSYDRNVRRLIAIFKWNANKAFERQRYKVMREGLDNRTKGLKITDTERVRVEVERAYGSMLLTSLILKGLVGRRGAGYAWTGQGRRFIERKDEELVKSLEELFASMPEPSTERT